MLTIADIRELALMVNDVKYVHDVKPEEDNIFIFKRLLNTYIDIEQNIINNGIVLSDAELMQELITRALFIYNLEPEMLEKKEEKNPDYPCVKCVHNDDNCGDYCYECVKGLEDNFEEKDGK